MVQLYYQGKKVAAHVRSFKAGGYSTVRDHLCSQHQHYRDRSPDYYRNLAAKKSPVLGQYVSKLFEQNRYPEQLYKTCDGLLSLFRKADLGTFEKPASWESTTVNIPTASSKTCWPTTRPMKIIPNPKNPFPHTAMSAERSITNNRNFNFNPLIV